MQLSYQFLCQLFPGALEKRVPGFAGLIQPADIEEVVGAVKDVEVMLAQVADWPEDVNVLLKTLKQMDRKAMSIFIDSALEYYFSHPAVTQTLTSKKSPLFPNVTVLDDIDYNLLEPVLMNIEVPVNE